MSACSAAALSRSDCCSSLSRSVKNGVLSSRSSGSIQFSGIEPDLPVRLPHAVVLHPASQRVPRRIARLARRSRVPSGSAARRAAPMPIACLMRDVSWQALIWTSMRKHAYRSSASAVSRPVVHDRRTRREVGDERLALPVAQRVLQRCHDRLPGRGVIFRLRGAANRLRVVLGHRRAAPLRGLRRGDTETPEQRDGAAETHEQVDAIVVRERGGRAGPDRRDRPPCRSGAPDPRGPSPASSPARRRRRCFAAA